MAQSLEFGIVGKSNASQVMGQAGKEADKLAKKLEKAFDIKGAITGALISAFGAAALLDKAINTVAESFREMAKVSQESEKAGISADEFSKLSFAAEKSGVSMEILGKAVRQLKVGMKDALTDTQKMTYFTKGLGFAEDDVREGKVSSLEIIKRIAEAISKEENEVRRLEIATKFLSERYASELLPTLLKIGANGNVFDGLNSATDGAYRRVDELDNRFSKLWYNIKRGIGESLTDQDKFFEDAKKRGWSKEYAMAVRSSMGMGGDVSLMSAMNRDAAVKSAYKESAPATALNSKTDAKYLGDAVKKDTKGDNTIANSLGASLGNGPTSGVIGVGNNATFSLMEEQLTTLKGIKDGIDRLAPAAAVDTDFTKIREQLTY
jgi:hypothetical protein